MMNNKYIILLGVGIAAVAIVGWLHSRQQTSGALDEFAQCLVAQGAVMYGAEWCPHCQNEKEAFGNSFRFIPYVECPAEPKTCIAKNITGYPTWIIKDKLYEGEQGLQKLSLISGCALPADSQK